MSSNEFNSQVGGHDFINHCYELLATGILLGDEMSMIPKKPLSKAKHITKNTP